MKIISYNVNGLRAAIRNGITDWIKTAGPDILCFQELKLQEDQYPYDVFRELGYESYICCAEKKGYSGVAILTKNRPDHIEYGTGIEKYDKEGRMIRADFGSLSVMSVYHPSGTSGEERQAFKMQWLDDFRAYINNLKKERNELVICGDFNIAHEAIDIHDPVGNARNSGFLPEERQWMTDFLSDGYTDSFRYLNPQDPTYSWWSYRFRSREKNKGWRIDYCIVTDNMRGRVKNAWIMNDAVHSDHCPVGLEYSAV